MLRLFRRPLPRLQHLYALVRIASRKERTSRLLAVSAAHLRINRLEVVVWLADRYVPAPYRKDR